MSDLTIQRGDHGFYVSGVFQNSDGTVFDLTNYTLTIEIWESSHWRHPFVEGTCQVTSSTEGAWKYAVATSNFLVPGTYSVGLRATKTGARETSETYTLEVEEAP